MSGRSHLFGKIKQEIIRFFLHMSKKLESWNKFIDSCNEEEPDYEKSWFDGYNSCKQDVLKILKTAQQNLDLSQENCDSRFIEEIEKL